MTLLKDMTRLAETIHADYFAAYSPLAGGKTWKVALPVGYPALSLADSTPEAALMLAIQEVYA